MWIFFQYIGNFFGDLQLFEKLIDELYDFLNKLFSLACFCIRIQFILHIAYKMCVNRLFICKALVNCRLFVIKFLGHQKLHVDFQLRRGWNL